jgi:predicted nucleic acid-binding protein
MVIVDTTVWIDYLRGEVNRESLWLEREMQRQRLGLTDLILCEVLQGIRDGTQSGLVQTELLRFEIFPVGGIGQCVRASENCRILRKRGYTVRKTIDCLIATLCIDGGHALLHRDRDFDPFENVLGLRVIHA